MTAHHTEHKETTLATPARMPAPARVAVAIAITVLFLAAGTAGSALAANTHYAGRLLPRTFVAGVDVGGLDATTAGSLVQSRFDELVEKGLRTRLFREEKKVDLAPTGALDPDLIYPLVSFNAEEAVAAAASDGGFFTALLHVVGKKTIIPARVSFAETRLVDTLKSAYPNAESPGTPTDFAITGTVDEPIVAVTPAVAGATINIDLALRTLERDATDLSLDLLDLELIERGADVTTEGATTLIPQVEQAIRNAPYTLTFTTEEDKELKFPITAEDLRTWLQPVRGSDGKPKLWVDTAAMKPTLDAIHAAIDVSAQDAVFVVAENRVTDFSPSRTGVRADEDAFLAGLSQAFQNGTDEIAISVAVTEPDLTTAESNDYGIKESLGTGYSSFSGSPSNRRKNIRHGVEKLNGLLIAPGETLSLLENLRPFTIADGYLPELVIKGDEIKPEIGGGLCQIGTTTFRAALNSGLEIAERRNHSLVVSYYNDPANNNPGTDATIYDPAPDLKIKNDTGAYVMLHTELKEDSSELFFSFWGTSDGRKASYTPPKVLSWSGYGAPVIKETDTLPPGKKTCQAGHPGAVTTFTYTIIRPDGTLFEQEFRSTYRSLPQICLVGKADAAPEPPGEVVLE